MIKKPHPFVHATTLSQSPPSPKKAKQMTLSKHYRKLEYHLTSLQENKEIISVWPWMMHGTRLSLWSNTQTANKNTDTYQHTQTDLDANTTYYSNVLTATLKRPDLLCIKKNQNKQKATINQTVQERSKSPKLQLLATSSDKNIPQVVTDDSFVIDEREQIESIKPGGSVRMAKRIQMSSQSNNVSQFNMIPNLGSVKQKLSGWIGSGKDANK